MTVKLECANMVSEKENELIDLRTRMDNDLKLYRLDKFYLKDYNNKNVEKVDNVTGNDPELFASRALSLMNTANMRIIVDGLEQDKATVIEEFLWWALAQADRRLVRKRKGTLRENLTFGAGIRGWTGSRTLVWKDGDEVIFDILPIDMRYGAFDMGAEDIAWGSNTIAKTNFQIEREYKFATRSKSKSQNVVDFWDDKENIIYIKGSNYILSQWAHGLGKPPVIIEPVMLAPPIGDMGDVKYWGESFFAGTRGLYAEKNKLATIMQTVNVMGFKPPMGFKSAEGNKYPETSPYAPGGVIAIKTDEGFMEIPFADIKDIAPFMYREISAAIQRRTFSYVEYGELGFELSAVAIAKLGQGRMLVLAPFMSAVKLQYRQIAEAIIKQFIDQDLTVTLGAPGKKKTYTAKELKGDYEISFDFVTISPEENIANYSVAAAARPFLDDDTIRETIIKLDDPKGVAGKVADQLAEVLSPATRLYRIYKVLVESEKFDEAELVWMQLEAMLQPQPSPQLTGGGNGEKPEKPGLLQPSIPKLIDAGSSVGEGAKRMGLEEQ